LIGFFVNSQVLRTSLAGNPTFRELLRRVRQTALDAQRYQDVPFEKLVDELRPKGYKSVRNPLFRTAFALQNTPTPELKLPGVVLTPFNRDSLTAKFDLTTTFLDVEDGLTGVIEYSTDIFRAETITAFIERYLAILETLAVNPDVELIDVPMEKTGNSDPASRQAWPITEQFDFLGA
jgi:non-ribosomal peptide synthetase component F